MQILSHLIETRQDWLVDRILDRAKRHGYARLTSTLLLPWQESARQLSLPVLEMLELGEVPPEPSLSTYQANPFDGFAKDEASAHRDRGVPLSVFMGLIKHYRAAFHDLIEDQCREDFDRTRCHRFIDRCLDLAEIAFIAAWEGDAADNALGRANEVNRTLTNEKNRYLTIFESLTDPVILLDSAKRLINKNHAACQLFDAEAIPGEGYYGDGANWPFDVQKLPLFSDAAGSCETECRLETRRGARDFHVRSQKMLDVSEKFSGWVVIFSDITDIREGQRAADAANRAKTTFLATMSHEVRTPINGVLGLVELLQATHLDSRQAELVDGLLASGAALAELAEDVLDYTRLESGLPRADPSPVEPRQLLSEVAAIVRDQCERKGLRLETDVAEACPVMAMVDRPKLRRILLNLAVNAAKFTEKGVVKLSVAPSTQGLRFTVADTGPGIPAELSEEIFEPFVRHEGAHGCNAGGAGLGLAICRRLAESMGADVRAGAGDKGGAVFTVECPLGRVDGSTRAPEAPAPTSFDEPALPARVLLVEDDRINALVVEGFLVAEGHAVTHVESAEAALASLEGTDYDLIVMDVRLHGIGGFEAIRHIRAHRSSTTRAIPVLVVTADGIEEAESAAMKAGASTFLAKPFSGRAFRRAIRVAMGHRVGPVAPNTPSTSERPVLLADVIDGHRAALGPSSAQRLVTAFLDMEAEQRETLRALAAGRDNERLADAAHRLRSGASVLGLARLAEVAAALERDARRSGKSDCLSHVTEDVCREIDAAANVLRQKMTE